MGVYTCQLLKSIMENNEINGQEIKQPCTSFQLKYCKYSNREKKKKKANENPNFGLKSGSFSSSYTETVTAPTLSKWNATSVEQSKLLYPCEIHVNIHYSMQMILIVDRIIITMIKTTENGCLYLAQYQKCILLNILFSHMENLKTFWPQKIPLS